MKRAGILTAVLGSAALLTIGSAVVATGKAGRFSARVSAILLAFLGLAAVLPLGALAQVSAVGSWTTGLTHSPAAGSNRILVFFAGNENGKFDTTLAAPTRDIVGVTYGGQGLTQAAESAICTTSAANEWFCGRNEIWYLGEAGIAAATGTAFSVTWADADTLEFDEAYAAVTLADADQVTPMRWTGANSSTSVDPLRIPSARGVSAGDFVVIGSFAGNASSYTADTDYTESTDQQSTPVVSSTLATAFKAIAAPGTEQPGMDFDGSINRLMVTAIAFKEPTFGVGLSPILIQADELPTNGTNQTVDFTVTNNGTGIDDIDLLTSTDPGTVVTVISVTGPGITQGANPDSARITGVPPGGNVTATVTYSIAMASIGAVDTLFISARSTASPSEVDSGRLELTVARPALTIGKSVTPTGIQTPGTDLTYTIEVTNFGTEDAVSIVSVDSLPAEVEFQVGSVSNTLPTGVTVLVDYSDDGGSTWSYTPASGACGGSAGHDRCVDRIRWRFQNPLGSSAPDNQAQFEYVTRIR